MCVCPLACVCSVFVNVVYVDGLLVIHLMSQPCNHNFGFMGGGRTTRKKAR